MSIWDAWSNDPKYTQLINDPSFLAAAPAFQHNIHDILYKYGFTPTADQSSLAGGMAVEDNPYSVAGQLKKNYATADHGSMNTLNQAGLEESGAAVGALHANAEGYKQNVSNALASEGGEINNATTGFTGTINDIFGRLEANPAVPAAPAPIAPVTFNPNAGGVGMATPQGPYQRTGPEAGGPMTAASMSVVNKLKKTTLPGIGGMGHIT